MLSVDALPSSIGTILQLRVSSQFENAFHTVHDNFHVVHKSMDYFECLRDGHPAFLLRETVEPL